MPDALKLVGPTEVLLLIFFGFTSSVISYRQVVIVVSSLYSFDFDVLRDVVLMSEEPFTRTEQMSCVYYSTKTRFLSLDSIVTLKTLLCYLHTLTVNTIC